MASRTTLKLMLAALLGFGASGALAATKVGVTSAVNPDAFRQEGGGNKKLILGEPVIFQQRILTSQKGLVQILLIDGSSFTVGPNSDLVIDEFVYDPVKNTGKLTASLTKGVFRFIGGKLSKTAGAVKVKTPLALIGIRGAITNVSFDPSSGQASCSLVFGNHCTVNGSSVYQPGYTASTGGGGSSVEIQPTSQQQIQTFQTLMSGPLGSNGGVFNAPTDQNVQGSQIDRNNSGNSPGQNAAAGTPNTVQSTDANEAEDELAQDSLFSIPEVKRVQQRILLSGATFTTGGGTVLNTPGASGIVGGSAAGDQNVEFSGNDSLLAASTAQGTTTYVPLTNNGATSNTVATSASTPFGSATGNVFLGAANAFTFYQLFIGGNADLPYYFVNGTATPTAALTGDGGVRTYSLTQDPRQLVDIPFADADFGGSVPSGTSVDGISDFLLVEPNGAKLTDDTNQATTGTPVFLQASVSFDGTGSAQSSVGMLVAGNTAALVDDAEIVRRRGSVRRAASELSFASGASAQQIFEGPTGKFFYGANADYFLVGTDFDGSAEVNQLVSADNQGLANEDLHSSTVHVAELTGETPLSGLTRSLTTVTGYASGMVESLVPNLTDETNLPFSVRNLDPDDVTIEFNAALNQLGGFFIVGDNGNALAGFDPDVDSYKFSFGFEPGNTANFGHSAYIDDDRYGAIQNDDNALTTVTTTTGTFPANPETDAQAKTYVFSSGVVNDVLPEGKVACTTCAFLEWGYWGTKFTADDGGPPSVDRSDWVHLGVWAAGDLPDTDQLPTGSATYTGHAVASVARSDGATLNQYMTSGDLSLNWNFNTRTGDMTVSNFDGANTLTSTDLTMPATPGITNVFTGTLSDGSNLAGNTTGSFARDPASVGAFKDAQGVVGNFSVSGTLGGDNYRATGIYVGSTP